MASCLGSNRAATQSRPEPITFCGLGLGKPYPYRPNHQTQESKMEPRENEKAFAEAVANNQVTSKFCLCALPSRPGRSARCLVTFTIFR